MEYHEGREFVATYMKPENIIVLSVFLYSATCTCISTLYAMFLLVLCIVLFKYYLEIFLSQGPHQNIVYSFYALQRFETFNIERYRAK